MNILARPSFPNDGEQRLVLQCIRWDEYVAMGEALRDHPNIQMTFDRGYLEIMTLSPEHERYKHVFVLLMAILTLEVNVTMDGYGSTTMSREDLERGLEADECYWVKNQDVVRGMKRLDLSKYPAPDFVIEIDITRTSDRRITIYRVLGVREVWRFDGENIQVYLLDDSGNYQESEKSELFPQIPMQEIARFVRLGVTMSEQNIMREFRAWLQEHLRAK